MQGETEKAGPQRQRIKQPHSQESDKKDNHLRPKGSPCETQPRLGSGKRPLSAEAGVNEFLGPAMGRAATQTGGGRDGS